MPSCCGFFGDSYAPRNIPVRPATRVSVAVGLFAGGVPAGEGVSARVEARMSSECMTNLRASVRAVHRRGDIGPWAHVLLRRIDEHGASWAAIPTSAGLARRSAVE